MENLFMVECEEFDDLLAVLEEGEIVCFHVPSQQLTFSSGMICDNNLSSAF